MTPKMNTQALNLGDSTPDKPDPSPFPSRASSDFHRRRFELRQAYRNPTEKCLADFFKSDPGNLPSDFRSVVWHPSAGFDFSPLVVFSRAYVERKETLNDLTPATLHIMTCLGFCEERLWECLESPEKILFEDDRTLMRIASYDLLELKNAELWQSPSPRHYYLGERERVFRKPDSDGFVAQVEIHCKVSGYCESAPLLYLLSENIATYEHFIQSRLFQVRHIKAVCEGLAFGGCLRSLTDFIGESGLGLETLESVWLRPQSSAGTGLRKFPAHGYDYQFGPLPMIFSGELARLSKTASTGKEEGQ